MGLSSAVARLASRRLHVLLVEHPGAFVTRAGAERAVLARGWVLATSPADADVLLECGAAADERLATAVEQVWSQVPEPRSRALLLAVAGVQPALDALAEDYRRWSPDRAGPRPGAGKPDSRGRPDATDEMGGGEHAQGSGDDMDNMDDMDMSGPGGIALASGSDGDRDGLEMDVLHLRLGPVLASWPVGLVVTCTLTGDVVSEVEVEVTQVDAGSGMAPVARAFRLDAAARVLDLAGADGLAARARAVRDQVLDDQVLADLDDLNRRVDRSRALRWSLRRVGVVSPQQAHACGWPPVWVGDAHDRLLRLTEARGEQAGAATGLDTLGRALPDLLVGCELASARLTVASLVGLGP